MTFMLNVKLESQETATLYITNGNVKWLSQCEKQFKVSSKGLKELPHYRETAFLSVYPKELKQVLNQCS